MKLGTLECDEALRKYKTEDRIEKLMIELLLIDDIETALLRQMAEEIYTQCTQEEIDNLASVVTKLRNEIGIEG